jgi:nitrogen regulatory protein PII
MNMILFILHDPEKLRAVLAAWEEAGVSGVTVLLNTGLGRIHINEGLRDDLPLMPSLEYFYPNAEQLGRTLIAIVKDEETVKKVIDASIAVVGDLSEPNTGLLVVLPTSQVYGLNKKSK